MPVYQPITDTSEFSDALNRLQKDVPNYLRATGLRTNATVRIPKPLTDLIIKRGDVACASVQRKIAQVLDQFCEIGDWKWVTDDDGSRHLQFKLIKERVRDEG